MTVDISGLNKADVLAALYTASKPLGMGFLHYDPTPMTREQAQGLIDRQNADDPVTSLRGNKKNEVYFDYVQGRVMKFNMKLDSDELDEWGYDRDNGEGAMQRVIDTLRKTGDPASKEAREQAASATLKAALNAYEEMEKPTYVEGNTVHLGLNDVADHLTPRVHEAIKHNQKIHRGE